MVDSSPCSSFSDVARNSLSANSTPSTVSPTNSIGTVSVKPGPFWRNNPDLWFGHLEAQFGLAGITSDKTKYFTVVSALDESIVRLVSDVVSSPPASEKYKKIKEVLVNRLAGSESQKLRQLLTELTLGDAQPSQLLREMRSLAQNKLTDSILQSLWMQRLPAHMQTILSCNTGSLDELAACADKIAEVNFGSEIHSVSDSQASRSSEIDRLTSQVAHLTKLVEQSLKSGRSSRPRSIPRNRRNSNYRENSKSKFCWYHSRYGTKAQKCIAPCSYIKKTDKHATN